MDYIIIQKDGGILPFAGGELPSGRAEFPIYGDLDEVRKDFCSEEDLCIIGIDYQKTGNKTIAKLMQDENERYDFGKEVAQFTYDNNLDKENSYYFSEMLLDCVTLYDFVSHQLPH